MYQANLGYITIAMKQERWDIQGCLEETTPIVSTDATEMQDLVFSVISSTEMQDLVFSVINSNLSLTWYFLVFSHI